MTGTGERRPYGTERRQYDTASIMHGIGQLTGIVQTLQQGTFSRFDDLKNDLHRLEESQNKRMSELEARLTRRMDDMGNRLGELEAEDKRQIAAVARMSAKAGGIGGGISGTLTVAMIELLKRLASLNG